MLNMFLVLIIQMKPLQETIQISPINWLIIYLECLIYMLITETWLQMVSHQLINTNETWNMFLSYPINYMIFLSNFRGQKK